MATLYRRSNGWYYAQFHDASKHPALKQTALKTKQRREAERRLYELEESGFCPWTEQQGRTSNDKKRLGVAVQVFMESRGNLRPETVRRYKTVIGQMHQHLGDEKRVDTITAADLQAYLAATKTKPVTKQSYRRAMKTFFNWLIEYGIIKDNPAEELRLEKVPQKHPRFLSPENVAALCKVISMQVQKKHVVKDTCLWLIPIVEANVYLGLRAGELCNLKWEHIDFDRRVLKVCNTETFTTKAGKERTMPLCDAVLRVLDNLERRCEYVFPNHGGTQLHKQYLSRRFKHFARLVKLPEYINFHSTRHTAASWLAQQGCNVEAIRCYMGHSSITTTQKYMHLSPDALFAQINQSFGRIQQQDKMIPVQ